MYIAFTRRLTQINGIREDQIKQVRGFADQRMRKPEAPLDPSNRRISFIVQYIQKATEEAAPAARRDEGTKTPRAKQAGPPAEQGAKSTAGEAAAATPGNPPEKKGIAGYYSAAHPQTSKHRQLFCLQYLAS